MEFFDLFNPLSDSDLQVLHLFFEIGKEAYFNELLSKYFIYDSAHQITLLTQLILKFNEFNIYFNSPNPLSLKRILYFYYAINAGKTLVDSLNYKMFFSEHVIRIEDSIRIKSGVNELDLLLDLSTNALDMRVAACLHNGSLNDNLLEFTNIIIKTYPY